MEIEGNAEGVYFVADDNKQLKGMHHMRCSRINILVEDEVITGITFQNDAVGIFYPPQRITEKVKKLDNSQWRGSERPTKQEVTERGYGTQEAYKGFELHEEH